MYRNDFIVDKITNSIEDVVIGKKYDTEVLPITSTDLKIVLKKNRWHFNWRTEFKNHESEVYKLVIKNDRIVQGLISLKHDDKYIEMPLIEVAPHNYGKSKKYVGVAGNLVAYACKMSFSMGFGGVVGFKAKTKLIQHYINTLGAEIIFKDRMSINEIAAKKLVNSYYKNYFDGK